MSITTKIKVGETAKTITLPEGKALTIKPTEGSSGPAGVAYLLDQALGGTNSKQSWTIGASVLPPITGYSGTQKILINCTAGSIDAVVGDAVLGAPQISASGGGLIAPDGGPVSTLNPILARLQLANAKILSAKTGANLAWIDDSKGVGAGGGTGQYGLVGARVNSPIAKLVAKLIASGVPAAEDSFFGDHLITAFALYPTYDPRLRLIGGAGPDANGGIQSLGGVPWSLNAAGKGIGCWRRPNTDPPCRSKNDPGRGAAFLSSSCG